MKRIAVNFSYSSFVFVVLLFSSFVVFLPSNLKVTTVVHTQSRTKQDVPNSVVTQTSTSKVLPVQLPVSARQRNPLGAFTPPLEVSLSATHLAVETVQVRARRRLQLHLLHLGRRQTSPSGRQSHWHLSHRSLLNLLPDCQRLRHIPTMNQTWVLQQRV
jgi:hypothetical protein